MNMKTHSITTLLLLVLFLSACRTEPDSKVESLDNFSVNFKIIFNTSEPVSEYVLTKPEITERPDITYEETLLIGTSDSDVIITWKNAEEGTFIFSLHAPDSSLTKHEI